MENNKQILRLVLHNCSSDKSMMVMLHLSVSTLNTMYISTQQVLQATLNIQKETSRHLTWIMHTVILSRNAL